MVREGGERTVRSYATREEAVRVLRAVQQEVGGALSIPEALDAFEVWLKSTGVKPVTVATSRQRLNRILGDEGGPVSSLTSARCGRLYEGLRSEYEVQTHRHTLAEARRFGAWAVKQGHVKRNPFAEVEAVGTPKRGKPQLRVDEARRLLTVALAAIDGGDPTGWFPVLCLVHGLRAAEVARLQARDVDDGARLLWIDDAKTPAGRRQLEVPALIRDRLRAAAAGRVGLLWEATRYSVHWHCDRLCRLARVPEIGPHGLRGTHATLATRAGATAEHVAASLGHESTEVARRHYTDATALEQARGGRTWSVLTGGRP